ncbi:Urease accessory protein UreD [Gloeothece citriformis PCC 7424]|uniref:Urease accessory protein UreD n=1 Tax=Gloeothece citriformis (strain PCC 7424) TaxID=65393 RepID=B7K909_GLOC7|nr:Urease accessory protein UreD [Gloeothece citriformis PCC 7424]
MSHQYTAYPLGISRLFRRDGNHSHRGYLYITSMSPGLLANDHLTLSLNLTANTQLFLTDQSATKVHPMPISGSKASNDYDIEIGERAFLEFIPHPIILFKQASFEQKIKIKCHPKGQVFWSEIIIPGRLTRGEFYDFNYYFNRLEVTGLEGELWFTEAMRLEGKDNPFKTDHLFASCPILGNIIIIFPPQNLQLLKEKLEKFEPVNGWDLKIGTSILPQHKGLLVRAIANNTEEFKTYLKYAVNCVRYLNHHPMLSDKIL